MKLKKTKKSKGMRGVARHGHGARKKAMESGHRGGFGMAGTGKRADHKKFMVIKQYGTKYFGKQGHTSRKTERDTGKVMNLYDLQKNIGNLLKKAKDNIINLEKYKILGTGEIKDKIKVKVRAISKTAKEKIEKAGGEVILPVVKEKPVKKVVKKEEKKESVNKPETKK